jgi:hypothetical protein
VRRPWPGCATTLRGERVPDEGIVVLGAALPGAAVEEHQHGRVLGDAPFPGFLEDGAAALAWVRDNITTFGGDPRRIVGPERPATALMTLGSTPAAVT